MKKNLLFTLIGIFIALNLQAQDGSDIRYYKPEAIDSTLVGKLCHVDFGKDSFAGLTVDTIQLVVKGQTLAFYEHREDNGFNNWFDAQYLLHTAR